jgi:diguanylate cyclase (GGDEF)-like protein/PAS domain S-box-containing protein
MRQLRRHLVGEVPADLAPLLTAVDEAYAGFDEDRALSERSAEIASQELLGRNRELSQRHAEIDLAHQQLQALHADLQKFNDELESRVAQRTAELREANRRLQTDLAERERFEQSLTEIKEKFRSMFENATDGIFQTTADGHYLTVNPSLARIYGYDSPAELIAGVTDIARRLYVDEESRPRFRKLIEERGIVSGFEARIYRKDGSIIWISETARSVHDAAGNFLYYEGFVSDITARKTAQDALRESEERYALAMRGANDGLWDWNLRTGQVHFSTRWKEMLGCGDEQIQMLLDEWFSRVHPDDLESLQSAIAAHRDGVTPHFAIEHRMRHADSGYRWMLARGIAIRDEAGRAVRMAGSQTDVTTRREAEEQLLRDALHDHLTGLPNRALFLDRLERSITRINRDGDHRFAVLFLDLDRFKCINDGLGHDAGDQLLVAFSRRLTACLRPSDTAARLGGDEFTVLLEDPCDAFDGVNIAERILEALKVPFHLGSHEVFVTASIGIAPSTTGYARPQDVLRDADTAMYRAKAKGKSCYEVFDAEMHARAVKLLKIENDLRRAVDRHEFELHYQPIVNIATGRIRAFEALVRWRHPEMGLISPVEFIPIAEETGLIVQIGSWVLFEACRQTAAWHAQVPDNPVDINVNLSGKQFSQPDLTDQVMQALRQSGLDARHLILEITESVVMDNPEATVATLHRLKGLGLKINIDDFGTGYSSLAYLQKFPVDTMKIDRSFIARVSKSAESSEIVRTIVHLAHSLNMKVTAEGIENAEQLEHLQKLNCENAQGYLFSKPVDAAGVLKLLLEAQTGIPVG